MTAITIWKKEELGKRLGREKLYEKFLRAIVLLFWIAVQSAPAAQDQPVEPLQRTAKIRQLKIVRNEGWIIWPGAYMFNAGMVGYFGIGCAKIAD